MKAAVQPYASPLRSVGLVPGNLSTMISETENLDEREVISSLRDSNFGRRSEILDRLRNHLRTQHSLPFQDNIGVYQALNAALSDTTWDIRHQCILFVSESIPFLRVDTDACMAVILPRLITFIGDSKITIRRGVIQTLHVYMKYTNDMPLLMNYYRTYGLESKDTRVRKEAVVSIPLLITADFAGEDFSDIIISLCKKLVNRDEEDSIQQFARMSLTKIHNATGDSNFRSHLMKLTPQLRDFYCKLVGFSMDNSSNGLQEEEDAYYADSRSNTLVNEPVQFGIVPTSIMAQISDEGFRTRAQGVEQLKTCLESQKDIALLLPHVQSFIEMLNSLLDDNNFKIITVTLDILGMVVEKTGPNIKPYLMPVIHTLTKRMGDNKNVIRQGIYKVIRQLMQSLGPKLVLLLLTDNLIHRNSRVRTETINCIIGSLLTFPSYEFDFNSLCSSIAVCLIDSKKAVRHAALECVAVLAQCLGAGKLQPLLTAVSQLEAKYGLEAEGVMAAVQARLTRRVLPRRNEDNLIEYAIQLPNLNSSHNGNLGQHGVDVDWIMAGSGGGGSSARSMRVEDIESASRQSSASLDGRRFLSAGKKSKLPWEEGQARSPNSSAAQSPVKSRQTWSDDKVARSGTLPRPSKPKDDLLLTSLSVSKAGSLDDLSASPNQAMPETPTNKQPFSKSSSMKALSNPFASNKNGMSNEASARTNGGTPMLNPLNDNAVVIASVSNTWGPSYADTSNSDSSASIPNKPSSVIRSNTRKSKVPPISKSHSPTEERILDHNDNEIPQLNASLNKIRNSANKKKLEKLFDKIGQKQSEPSTPTASKSENPFQAKPKLARHATKSDKSPTSEVGPSEPTIDRKPPAPEPKLIKNESKKALNPLHDSDMVAVVGKGYSDDAVETPPKLGQSKPKERRRNKPVATLSPLGQASSSAPGMIPLDDDDLGAVVGKGMFEGDTKIPQRSNSISKSERNNNSLSNTSISKSSSGYEGSSNLTATDLVDSDDDVNSVMNSNSLKEKAARRIRERQEESAAKRKAQLEAETRRVAEEEQRLQDAAEAAERRKRDQDAAAERRRKQIEKQRQEIANRQLDSGLSVDGKASSPTKPPSAPKVMTPRSPASSSSTFINDDALKPFTKPDVALREAMKLIAQNEDWVMKCDGLNHIRRLAQFHCEILVPQLHQVTLSVLSEVKNLRTQVSRLGVICLGDMFTTLTRKMDPELDQCAKILLHKNGEANEFIRTELDRTLTALVCETTPQRALTAVLSGGSGHKNIAVRKVAVMHMVTLCEKLGPGKCLSGVKDVTDKILPAICQLCSDGSPETRWYTKKLILMLMQHPDFEAVLSKNVSAKDQRNLKVVMETLRQKGLGDMPSDTPSAKGARRSGTFNRGSRQGSAESSVDGTPPGPKSRPSFGGNAEDVPFLENMSSSQWNQRHQSITDMVALAETKNKLLSIHSVKIFDKYSALLKDSNSKVALHALQSFSVILPQIKKLVTSTHVNMLVQNTAFSLASKNRDIYDAASALLDTFINNIDHVMLFQPYVQVATNATSKTKADLIDRVAYLCRKVYHTKQKMVILHALPLAWSVVQNSTAGPLRGAVKDYIVTLHNLMDDSLFDHAVSAPNSSPALVNSLKNMIGEN